eukprot:9515166-Alexandrium_andersonii.AAC.1
MYVDKSDWVRAKVFSKKKEAKTTEKRDVDPEEQHEWNKMIDTVNAGPEALSWMGASLRQQAGGSASDSDKWVLEAMDCGWTARDCNGLPWIAMDCNGLQ